jgi:hypothetical protein
MITVGGYKLVAMAKRLLLSALAGIGVTLLLGMLAGAIAAVFVYVHLYNQEIDAFKRAMHEAEFECVPRETKPIQLDSTTP